MLVPVKARKSHQCSNCGKYIQHGDIYFKNYTQAYKPPYCEDCKVGSRTYNHTYKASFNPLKPKTRDKTSILDYIFVGIAFTGLVIVMIGLYRDLILQLITHHQSTEVMGYLAVGMFVFALGFSKFIIDYYILRSKERHLAKKRM